MDAANQDIGNTGSKSEGKEQGAEKSIRPVSVYARLKIEVIVVLETDISRRRLG
jgi:hypothetical protein